MRGNAGLRAALAFGLAWIVWAGALPAAARTIEIRYQATDVLPKGEPTFGLRLNDLFQDLDVDFSFEDVVFDVFDDDTARLHGLTRVAQVGSNLPRFDSFWNLDMEFERKNFNRNPRLEFFQLVDGELRSADNHGKAVIDLSQKSQRKPFRIGMQVIPRSACVPDLGDVEIDFVSNSNSASSKKNKKNKKVKKSKTKKPKKKKKKKKKKNDPCLAMAGWVFWEHGGGERGSGDLVAQLTETEIPPGAPEPALGILMLFGLGLLGLRRAWQR